MEIESYFDSSSHVKELKPVDFDKTISWKLKKGECCAILFYSPQCPFCKKVKDSWEKLGRISKFFNIYAFNAVKYKKHTLQIREELPDLISGYPTMIIYKLGEPVEKIGEDERERTSSHFLKAVMRACKS